MILPPATLHPQGEEKLPAKTAIASAVEAIEVDTFDGKVHMEWDPDAMVTPIGQLPFFIQFLKIGNRFLPWIEDSPLTYASNNAPKKINLLGSLFLSILSGHKRYSHIITLLSDKVNPQLLGMTKVVSDDSARRGLQRIDEAQGVQWLQKHLNESYQPLLTTPWILDTDVTVKPLYGHQEGAKKGYNPHKPGRPSHTYHTYLIANLRLVLDVEVQPGDQSHSSHSLPGLLNVLEKLPPSCRPQFIRGDCDWGNDNVMRQLEEKAYHYLFKLKKTAKVKELVGKHHCLGEWTRFKSGWEAKESEIMLSGWNKKRRVVLVRRRLPAKELLALEKKSEDLVQYEFEFMKGAEEIKQYEYSVLVTNLGADVTQLVQHYRDRADCENYFDEIKNQWGWGGFTTQQISSCRLMSRMIALIYNWWTLFVRLANPDSHMEAITSRPLLLSSVGRLTQSGRQKKIILTSSHGKTEKIRAASHRLDAFFSELKNYAPQLTSQACWTRILMKAMEKFKLVMGPRPDECLPAPV